MRYRPELRAAPRAVSNRLIAAVIARAAPLAPDSPHLCADSHPTRRGNPSGDPAPAHRPMGTPDRSPADTRSPPCVSSVLRRPHRKVCRRQVRPGILARRRTRGGRQPPRAVRINPAVPDPMEGTP